MTASPETMRQVWITRHGPPEVLEVREAVAPEPGDNEVLIKVAAAGVNFADIMARLGLYPDAPKPPCVVGYEVAGEVTALGPSATGFAAGNKVIALTRFGGYSSHVSVRQEQVFALPTGLDFAQSAALPVTYLTAYQLVIGMGRLRAGETILVHSAAGGVGLSAIDLAQVVGAHVIGVASVAKHDAWRSILARQLQLPRSDRAPCRFWPRDRGGRQSMARNGARTSRRAMAPLQSALANERQPRCLRR